MIKRRNGKTNKLFAGFFALLFVMLSFMSAVTAVYGSEDQFAFLTEPGVRVGVSTGSIQEQVVKVRAIRKTQVKNHFTFISLRNIFEV